VNLIVRINLFFFISLLTSCGGKPTEDTTKTGNSSNTAPISSIPTPVNPAITPLPVVTPSTPSVFGSGFWVASSTQMFISRYDTNGNLVQPVIDLKGKAGTDGGITALHSLDQNTLLALVDPNIIGKSETIYSVDLRNLSNAAKGGGINTWLNDPSNSLYTKNIRSFITGIRSQTVMVPTQDKIFNVLYNTKEDSRELEPIPTLTQGGVAGCNYDELINSSVVSSGGKKSLLVLSSGSLKNVSVLNYDAGSWKCASSYSYSNDSETNTTHSAMNAVQTADGKVYILYSSSAAASKIVRYTFDGTSLSAPETIFADQSLLGSIPIGLAVRSNDKLLFGNRSRNRIFEVNVTKKAFEGFSINNSYVTNISTILSN
jgi:hypothetical protein